MVELEAKYKVSQHEIDAVLAKGLEQKKTSHQIDTYFLVNKTIEVSRHYLRVRKDISKQRFSIDYHIVLSEFEADETEASLLTTADADKAIAIIERLNYPVVCVVNKKRQAFVYGQFEIVVDDVEGLGLFIEIEALSPDVTADSLTSFAASLGLSDSKRVKKAGYPDLLMQQNKISIF